MTALRFSDISATIDARLIGKDGEFFGASTDSRHLRPGDLFVALRGPRFDGHDFVAQVDVSGVRAVMVDHPCNTAVTQIVVGDTRLGFGALAKLWRRQFSLPVIGVTGSNGKTTVKEMLAAILNGLGETLVTQGNLNNEIGVPMTLLRLRESHRYAVIEMGANHPKEIAYLTSLAIPDVGLITNAGPAHLEGFGDIKGVAIAKAELFEGLANNGTAVINADDEYEQLWRKRASHCHALTFGIENSDVAIRGEWRPELNRLLIRTAQGDSEVNLPLAGIHNARNALAAAAAAAAVGAGPSEIKSGLETMQPVVGRLYPRKGIYGLQILDDTYNANPASVKAALEVARTMPGEMWLVLGDMGELGPNTIQLHAEIGERASQCGAKRLYAYGPLSRAACKKFGGAAFAFDDIQMLIEVLRNAAQQSRDSQINLLIKGSRAMRMERVVAELLDDGEAAKTLRSVTGH